MAKSTCAHAVLDVEDDVVGLVRSYSHGNAIEPDRMSDFPRDDMIGAGRVATQT